jgi:hypothetical protein
MHASSGMIGENHPLDFLKTPKLYLLIPGFLYLGAFYWYRCDRTEYDG